GEIVRIRKNRYVLPSEADLVTGKLSIHQAGFGFLIPERSGEADIFVAAENTGTAMNGDRVVVRISRDVPPRRAKARGARVGQRTEGRVIRILERARDTIVGTLQICDRVVVRISRDVPPRRAKARGARVGQRTEGRVIRILERARDTIVGTL